MFSAKHLDKYRFEYLLIALVLLIFNKALVTDNELYIDIVWPLNMLILGISSIGIFREKKGSFLYFVEQLLIVQSILMPFLFKAYNKQIVFGYYLTFFYIFYYSFLLTEILKQITRKEEVTVSVILGSMSGYLLIILIALFAFVLVELNIPSSFSNITHNDLSKIYQELMYFSAVTITSTGYGDILPTNDTSRLTAAFFSIVAQFYMVALVGIIISKFTSRSNQ